MKKIILLENITKRQQSTKINFENLNHLENILGEENCNNKLDKFMNDNSIFNNYDVIIIHESIYFESERKSLFQILEKYCINNRILVKFSGNNSQSSLNQNILTLSSEKFYGNIEIYLSENEKNKANILMLAYGKNWKLNPLLNTLQSLNIFIENFNGEEEIDFDEFEDDFELLKLKIILNKEEYQKLFKNIEELDDEISIEQIKTITYNLQKLIKSKSNE